MNPQERQLWRAAFAAAFTGQRIPMSNPWDAALSATKTVKAAREVLRIESQAEELLDARDAMNGDGRR